MGRFESQRAIAARTISERRLGSKTSSRKRHGGWLAWFMGRLTGFALTVAAITTLAWQAPRLWTAAPIQASPAAQPAEAKFAKATFASKLTVAAPEAEPLRQRGRRSAAHRAHAPTAPAEPGYEVLGPDELAAISQAD